MAGALPAARRGGLPEGPNDRAMISQKAAQVGLTCRRALGAAGDRFGGNRSRRARGAPFRADLS